MPVDGGFYIYKLIYYQNTHTDNIDSREDVFIGEAMHSGGIEISQASDANGGERYGQSAQGQFDFDGKSAVAPRIFHKTFGLPPPKLGMDSISDQFISAHLKDRQGSFLKKQNHTIAELIYRYHAVLNDWCQ